MNELTFGNPTRFECDPVTLLCEQRGMYAGADMSAYECRLLGVRPAFGLAGGTAWSMQHKGGIGGAS